MNSAVFVDEDTIQSVVGSQIMEKKSSEAKSSKRGSTNIKSSGKFGRASTTAGEAHNNTPLPVNHCNSSDYHKERGNKVAPIIDNPTTLSEGTRPSIANPDLNKKRVDAFDKSKVALLLKCRKVGRYLFGSGCCMLVTFILLALSGLSYDRKSAFLFNLIWLGIIFFTQLSNIMQIELIRASIR
jgi:hypothetical protein